MSKPIYNGNTNRYFCYCGSLLAYRNSITDPDTNAPVMYYECIPKGHKWSLRLHDNVWSEGEERLVG